MLGSVSFRKARVPEGTSSEKTGSPAPPAEVTTSEEGGRKRREIGGCRKKGCGSLTVESSRHSLLCGSHRNSCCCEYLYVH